MYSALVELMQPEIDEATKKAREKAWDEAWGEAWDEASAKKTIEAIENAINKLHMSEEEACDFMDITIEQYREYKTRMKEGDAKKH